VYVGMHVHGILNPAYEQLLPCIRNNKYVGTETAVISNKLFYEKAS